MKNLYRFLAYSLVLTANVFITSVSNAQSSCSSNSDCGSCQTCSNITVVSTPGSDYSATMCKYFSPQSVVPSWLTSSCTTAGTCTSIPGCGNASPPSTFAPATSAPSTPVPSTLAPAAPFICTLEYMVNNPNTFLSVSQCADLKTLLTEAAPACFKAVSEPIVTTLQNAIQAYISSVPQENYSVLDVTYNMAKVGMIQEGLTPPTQDQFLQELVTFDSEASTNDQALVSSFCAGYYQSANPPQPSTGTGRMIILRQIPEKRGVRMLPYAPARPRMELFRHRVPVWNTPKHTTSLF